MGRMAHDDFSEQHGEVGRTRRPSTGRADPTTTTPHLIGLQRTAGNAAVAAMMAARQQTRAPQTGPAQRAATVQRVSYTDEDAEVKYQPGRGEDPSYPLVQNLMIKRPKTVSGTVTPTVTKGRGGAPDPQAVESLAEKYQAALATAGSKAKINSGDVWKDLIANTGKDRGHIMGLEVGGEDTSRNIVPQWSLNQQSGEWRDSEKTMTKKNKGAVVDYTVEYARDSGLWWKVVTPSGINVSVNGGANQAWDNAPDENDIAMGLTDPDDLETLYLDIKESVQATTPKGQPLPAQSDQGMDRLAFEALRNRKAELKDQEHWLAERLAGQTKPVSHHGVISGKITKSDIPKKKRKKLIEGLVAAGYVKQVNGKLTFT